MLHNWIQSWTFVQAIYNLYTLRKVKCLTLWNVHYSADILLVPTHQLTKTIGKPMGLAGALSERSEAGGLSPAWMLDVGYLPKGGVVGVNSPQLVGGGTHLEAVGKPGKKNPTTWTHPKMPWKKILWRLLYEIALRLFWNVKSRPKNTDESREVLRVFQLQEKMLKGLAKRFRHNRKRIEANTHNEILGVSVQPFKAIIFFRTFCVASHGVPCGFMPFRGIRPPGWKLS